MGDNLSDQITFLEQQSSKLTNAEDAVDKLTKLVKQQQIQLDNLQMIINSFQPIDLSPSCSILKSNQRSLAKDLSQVRYQTLNRDQSHGHFEDLNLSQSRRSRSQSRGRFEDFELSQSRNGFKDPNAILYETLFGKKSK